ncbi:MAG: hypothetical protein K2V38_00665 [Gemmataceae bacterium]|nr:hypothetical protein [Gemmataceae bacterium]
MNVPSRAPTGNNAFSNLKSSTATTIAVVPSTAPKLDVAEVAKALGAKPAGAAVEAASGPLTLFAVRQELLRRLQSTGGRPGLGDADKVAKVPVPTAQWARLEELAAALAEPGFSPSAGQVASVLLGRALELLGPDAVAPLKTALKASAAPGA